MDLQVSSVERNDNFCESKSCGRAKAREDDAEDMAIGKRDAYFFGTVESEHRSVFGSGIDIRKT